MAMLVVSKVVLGGCGWLLLYCWWLQGQLCVVANVLLCCCGWLLGICWWLLWD